MPKPHSRAFSALKILEVVRMTWKRSLVLAAGMLVTAGVTVATAATFTGKVASKESAEDIEEMFRGCSLYCAIEPKNVRASSHLKAHGKLKYDADKSHDGDIDTAWVEGKKGHGIGEYLEYTYDLSDKKTSIFAVTEITVFNGYRKNKTLWQQNSRVKRLRLDVNGKPHGTIQLQDAFNSQTVKLGKIKLPAKKKTTFRFTVLDVYKGSKYADTAIAELSFDGEGAH
jgi:hypothetical protein